MSSPPQSMRDVGLGAATTRRGDPANSGVFLTRRRGEPEATGPTLGPWAEGLTMPSLRPVARQGPVSLSAGVTGSARDWREEEAAGVPGC